MSRALDRESPWLLRIAARYICPRARGGVHFPAARRRAGRRGGRAGPRRTAKSPILAAARRSGPAARTGQSERCKCGRPRAQAPPSPPSSLLPRKRGPRPFRREAGLRQARIAARSRRRMAGLARESAEARLERRERRLGNAAPAGRLESLAIPRRASAASWCAPGASSPRPMPAGRSARRRRASLSRLPGAAALPKDMGAPRPGPCRKQGRPFARA